MDQEQLENKLRSWQRHLDEVVGILAFALAVSCAGISNSGIALVASAASIYVSFRAMDLGAHYFPEDLLELRESTRKTMRQKLEHDYAEGQLKKLKTPLLYMGFVSLFLVAVISAARVIISII
ncbi:hypothetical protein SAMN04488490_3198 [Marinobacter sp. LV10R510-11A]|uniref:hypothetical protein n=1 Tax=Marinobacter sp. LV10R510-11A TaxID=1415568 RepID=UPI000BB69915|nr:hypothetical protein [Marinobacter sp. LV10R510-11A]SOB77393.1 hypothetical protein SAMN04488490_3198 [Marinobacter sp. LV10R510-11A]